jgi:hypothetical protein
LGENLNVFSEQIIFNSEACYTLFVIRLKMRGSSREEPCKDRLFWYNISFKQRFLGCYAKENSTVRKLWHGPWAPALVQSHHNSMTMVPYLKDIKSVMGPYFVLSVLFPWLPNYPTKMCPVMTRHIFVLLRHKFDVLLYTPFGHVSYMARACITGPKIWVWASFIIFSKR